MFGTQDRFLPGAILINADLRGANLTGAKALAMAKLTGARYNARTRWPKGCDPMKAGTVLVR